MVGFTSVKPKTHTERRPLGVGCLCFTVCRKITVCRKYKFSNRTILRLLSRLESKKDLEIFLSSDKIKEVLCNDNYVHSSILRSVQLRISRVPNGVFGIRDLAYLKAAIREFGESSVLKLRTGHINWRFYKARFGKCHIKEPRSGKFGYKKVQKKIECDVLWLPICFTQKIPCFLLEPFDYAGLKLAISDLNPPMKVAHNTAGTMQC